ncbi:MAG: ribonuclease HIII [Bacilli bacterium]|nr:ribonuclease HIII [Bacilli bacterium]
MAKNNNNCVVLRVSEKTREKMSKFYEDKKRDKVIPYVVFQAQDGDTVITLYESGKVMFQGVSADIDANMWADIDGTSRVNTEMVKKEDKKYFECSSIGSDEVGTGDYFGPIVVTSCYVSKDDIPFLLELGIKDSKKLDDEKILKIAPELIKKIKYKSLIMNNSEYNEKYSDSYNINKIKAIMHNKVLWRMVHEEDLQYDYIIVDEFAREARYYEYLSGNPEIQRGITFMTKAEDKNLAVACASVISRYIFIKEFDKLSDSLHIPLVKGAGSEVDSIGKEVVDKYGKEKLKEIAKYNFKNTERILGIMIY